MKKTLVSLFLVVVLLASLFAPAMAEAKPEGWNNVNAEGYVYPDYTGEKIRFMWWGSDTRAKITTEVVELYEKLTGLEIEYEFYDYNTYFTKFVAYQAANDLPDVFQMGNNWSTYYDTIQPLNEWIENGTIDTTAISAAMLATTTNHANGDLTGMSNGTNARCFCYNPAIFDECGVPYPTANWTWDDFAAAGRTIYEKTGNPAVSAMEFNSIVMSTVTQWAEGYNFYTMDGSGFGFNGDIAPLVFITDLLGTLQAEGVIADYGIQNEISGNIESDWIAYGDSAMMMLSSNQFSALSKVAAESGITLELATLPRVHADGQSGMVVRSSQQMSMYSGSKNKDIAANFMNFFVNSVEANKILNCERGVSINSDVLAALQQTSDEVTAKVYAMIDLIGSFPDAALTSPAEPAANEEISNVLKSAYLQGYAEGKFESAQDCMEKFWAEAQVIWTKY